MAATVNVVEGNGSPVTWTQITSARFCTADTHNPGSSNPCIVPQSGETHYSYWKHHCLDLSGDFTQIDNIRFYTDGSIGWTLGTGGEVRVGFRGTNGEPHGCPESNYQQASGTEGTTGYAIEDNTNGHDYYKNESPATKNVENYTSSSSLLVDNNTYTSPSKTYSVVLQVKLTDDATQGAQPAETFTFTWDEI